jgi:hypothetical protein
VFEVLNHLADERSAEIVNHLLWALHSGHGLVSTAAQDHQNPR